MPLFFRSDQLVTE